MTLSPGLAPLTAACARAATSWCVGQVPAYDLAALLAAQGFTDLTRARDDDNLDVEVRQLAAMALPLEAATRSYAQLEVAGRAGDLAPEVALQELIRTADEGRMAAIALALHDSRVAALRGPLDDAQENLRTPALTVTATPEPAVVTRLKQAELLEMVRALQPTRRRHHRLVCARLAQSPLPLEHLRAELRPLLTLLGTQREFTLGSGTLSAGHAPAALATPHPARPRRYVVLARPEPGLGIARSLFVATGQAVGAALDLDDGAALGTAVASLLARPAFWRAASLSKGDARDAARHGALSMLGLVARLWSYLACGDDDVRAMASAAAELLDERDDVAAALRWRGPWPDPLGLPLPWGQARLAHALASLLRGLALGQSLVDAIGEDWHQAPEASEALLELYGRSALPADGTGLLATLVDG